MFIFVKMKQLSINATISLILLLHFAPIHGWSHYEKSIELAQKSEKDIFEFELELAPKLSMSSERNGELFIHDYEPETMTWTQRDKNQLRPCLEHWVMNFGNGIKGAPAWNRWEQKLPGLVQLHGRHQRLSAVNGQIPGPTLVVEDGAEVVLRIRNRLLLESVAIHVRGQTMAGKSIQKCPIGVRSDFGMRFNASQAGTYWYHGQFPNGHQSDGLLGAFIVLPKKKNGPTEKKQLFQKDYVAILQDWPLVPTWEQEEQWAEGNAEFARGIHGEFDEMPNLAGSGQFKTDGIWSILINGKGWHSPEDIRQRPHQIPWTTFRISKGDQIRLRLIHGGYRHPFTVHIEHHMMEIIAIDGTKVEPVRALDSLILYPGERFDVRVMPLQHPTRSTYHMVVGLAEQLFLDGPTNQSIYGLAVLDYGQEMAANQNWDNMQQAPVNFVMANCRVQPCSLFGCPLPNADGLQNSTADGRKFVCLSVEELIKNGTIFRAQNPGSWQTETPQNGHGAIRFENHRVMPEHPAMGFDNDCGTFDPGLDIYDQYEE